MPATATGREAGPLGRGRAVEKERAVNVIAAFIIRLVAEAAIELRRPGAPLWPHLCADILYDAADAYDDGAAGGLS